MTTKEQISQGLKDWQERLLRANEHLIQARLELNELYKHFDSVKKDVEANKWDTIN